MSPAEIDALLRYVERYLQTWACKDAPTPSLVRQLTQVVRELRK